MVYLKVYWDIKHSKHEAIGIENLFVYRIIRLKVHSELHYQFFLIDHWFLHQNFTTIQLILWQSQKQRMLDDKCHSALV